MIKSASLRSALVAAIPDLATNADKLTVFVDQGSIAAKGTKSLSFEYRYVCNVLLLDFGGDPDDVFIAVLEWARKNQPDLVTNWDQRSTGITYEIDILNNVTADVSIKLQLTESVVVRTDEDGRRIVTHVDDSVQPDDITWVAQPWPKTT
ncbi:phage tail protein [Burkholderia sp. Bp9015]|uniref:phage tail protein n=1 Tax=Burkholderia sp. Bp9015 TaxID=2184563 RepID=UPI000F59BA8A|nr:phage tail protein [Burkholderia sp. Bp9015]RQR78690.1 phage tail protein [Burkholderia sp. Bp9015]